MKQWIIFILGFLSFLAVALMIVVMVAGNKPFTEVEQQAIDRVKNEELLAEVKQAYVYANKHTAVTVIGTDAEGKLKAVFVPAGEGEMRELMMENAIAAKQAREVALGGMDAKKVLHTKLGLEKDGPVWEVVFINEKDQLNYVYILAADGSKWKQILNM
ncbi:DUF5590 domain-containing protein [Planococcus sp. APC 3906]|uniref:cell wall elongation regulator TseB-like domain-containing protein n=1 Tax=Planococcus TaxID=1372 RepID=UPI0025B40385|nr:DUF5590 domain-containing protein [Planococcus sp. APC 3906]MDN3450904.1 DUF5590 domain-containing protein [Planococcus sp. APC 3906]